MAKKHLVLMLLCCLIPIGVALGLLAFGVALNTTLLVAVMLLCPLLHMLLMSSMHGAAEHNVDSGRAANDHADFYIAPQHHTGEDAGN